MDDLMNATTPPMSTARPKPHRHRWVRYPGRLGVVLDVDDSGAAHLYPEQWCDSCHRWRDPIASRKGRSARRLGHDGERSFERDHGPTKIGERNDPVDHLGSLGKYQTKTTRGAVPARLRAIDRMDGLYGDRTPILVNRYVHQGRRTETYLTIRLRDWQALHGRDEE